MYVLDREICEKDVDLNLASQSHEAVLRLLSINTEVLSGDRWYCGSIDEVGERAGFIVIFASKFR